MSFIFETIMRAVTARPETDGPLLVGIAGPPASRKSTFSTSLSRDLEREGVRSVIVPTDGFLLDNRLPEERSLRGGKRLPETFDLGGFQILLHRLRARHDPVFLPVFDRERDLSIAAARRMTSKARVVIVEGNYLLFDEPGWRDLARCLKPLTKSSGSAASSVGSTMATTRRPRVIGPRATSSSTHGASHPGAFPSI